MQDKGLIHALGGMVADFITLFRMVCNLKLRDCLFLEVSIYYLPPVVDHE